MSACDMCGATGSLFKTSIEGSFLQVCKACTSYGKVLAKPKRSMPSKRKHFSKPAPKEESREVVVSNYAQLILKARQKSGMNQKDFSRKVNEKESVIHKIETGKFEPSLRMAKRLQKALNIKLVEEQSNEEIQVTKKIKSKSDGMTIGDLLKL